MAAAVTPLTPTVVGRAKRAVADFPSTLSFVTMDQPAKMKGCFVVLMCFILILGRRLRPLNHSRALKHRAVLHTVIQVLQDVVNAEVLPNGHAEVSSYRAVLCCALFWLVSLLQQDFRSQGRLWYKHHLTEQSAGQKSV